MPTKKRPLLLESTNQATWNSFLMPSTVGRVRRNGPSMGPPHPHKAKTPKPRHQEVKKRYRWPDEQPEKFTNRPSWECTLVPASVHQIKRKGPSWGASPSKFYERNGSTPMQNIRAWAEYCVREDKDAQNAHSAKQSAKR